jgi:hypothetical protein
VSLRSENRESPLDGPKTTDGPKAARVHELTSAYVSTKVGMSAAAQETAPLSFSSRRTDANGGVPQQIFLGMPNTTSVWCTCDLCATCDFWTLKRDSCIKRYPSGVCPSPARETAPGFHYADAGHPKTPWFFEGPTPGAPNASVFWPPPPRTRNPKTAEE